jgi:hypothetical protein
MFLSVLHQKLLFLEIHHDGYKRIEMLSRLKNCKLLKYIIMDIKELKILSRLKKCKLTLITKGTNKMLLQKELKTGKFQLFMTAPFQE